MPLSTSLSALSLLRFLRRSKSFPAQSNSYKAVSACACILSELQTACQVLIHKQTKWRATGRSKDDFGQRFSWAPLAFSSASTPIPPPTPSSSPDLRQSQPFAHIHSSLTQQSSDDIRLQARSVELHPHRSLLIVELHPPHPINLTHAVDSPQFLLAGPGAVAKHHFQISHAIIPLRV